MSKHKRSQSRPETSPAGASRPVAPSEPAVPVAPVGPAGDEEGGLDLLAYADQLQPATAGEQAEVVEAERAWISFRVAEQLCALKVEDVQEVLRVGAITRVPQAPRAVRGVTNMRGRVLPVVDMRVRLGFAQADALSEHSRLLVAIYKGRVIGLLVDGVEKMVLIRPSMVQEAPQGVIRGDERAILGVGRLEQRLLLLLDVHALLNLGNTASA